jgi:glycosyltransferase involved in cell wall biosynthesis
MIPLLSIILPTYNREKYLKIAIDSILKQSFSDFELIIIDDCSSDSSVEIVNQYDDPRINYFRQDKNRGEYWCTNYAVSIAKGKYLTWVHSDDILAVDSLKIRIEELENNPNLDFVHGDIEKIDENGNKITDISASDLNSEMLLREYFKMPEERRIKYLIHHLSIMMKTDFFRKTGGFDNGLPFAGDIDWLIRAIKMGNFKAIHRIIYYYRYHSQTRRVTDIENGVDKEEVNLQIINKYKKLYGFD